MADWPDLAELKRVLSVDMDDFDTTLARDLASAINHVKGGVGSWDDDADTPTDKQARAALRMAELLATRPEGGTAEALRDPTYMRLMTGQRRRFGIS